MLQQHVRILEAEHADALSEADEGRAQAMTLPAQEYDDELADTEAELAQTAAAMAWAAGEEHDMAMERMQEQHLAALQQHAAELRAQHDEAIADAKGLPAEALSER